MRWLFWSSGSQTTTDNNNDSNPDSSSQSPTTNTTTSSSSNPAANSNSNSQFQPPTQPDGKVTSHDWSSAFKNPHNLLPTLLLTSGILLSLRIHRKYLRRIPAATAISPTYFRKRSLLGRVTSVGDGDNFRMYHTPGGRLAGWGWLRQVPTSKRELKDRTIHIRLAGIDAPELAHFGRPAQPFAADAHAWLTTDLLHRRVRAHVYRQDQYGRVIATVYVRRLPFFWIRRDVGLQMLREGLATVYEAKSGVEFGSEGAERRYREAEAGARRRGRGLWRGVEGWMGTGLGKGKGLGLGNGVGKEGGEGEGEGKWESPREYKRRMKEMEAEAEAEGKGEKGGKK
ncbi:hypothetical protein AJ79_02025 [Helicocarpus griseus UAMH5409]|uniref:Probable endonuclease LCL3 n=1 Tax=Helicocarpus griseus UAMH5409 TaxID=1447875 RepID=A0A2B7Y4A8_9EURO|nr:hypothetical protein AJ79_02025 [Helicocarpus griseus UAMH5409]